MEQSLVEFKEVEDKIISLRGQQVLLDSQVAELYGVQTMRVNEAVANNPDKFPQGYIWELTKEEKREVIENFDNLKQLKFSPATPKAFTEKGLYMLATILKSERAIATTIAIVETFAKMREFARVVAQLPDATEDNQQSLLEKSSKLFGDILADNLEVTDSEMSVELNLAILKVKRTIKKNCDENN